MIESEQLSPTCSEATTNDESERPLLKQKETLVLLKFSFQRLFLFTFVPSVGSLILVFLVGFGLDYAQLLNYEWSCGKVLLPSISRIINLPTERVIWHLGMFLHVGLRPIFISQSYLLNNRPSRHHSKKVARFSKLLALAALISGLFELIFTIALTVVGERESGPIHVYFFVAFIISVGVGQLSSALSCRLSRVYKLHRQVRFCLKVRFALTVLLAILIPSIFLFFVLYWQYCVRMAYDLFASLEYATIFVIYAYHIVSIIDLRKFECQFVRSKK